MKETPQIDFSAWTKKDLRKEDVINKLIEIIAVREDAFKATAIYGGKLTKKQNKVYDCNNKDDILLFKNSLLNEDVLVTTLTNSDRKKREYIFGFSIDFSIQANILSFGVSHSYFTSKERKEKFIKIIKELIKISEPMFATVEDIGNSLKIMDKMGEETYQVHKYIPAIFWGNYFGEKYIEEYGREKLLDSPVGNIELIGNGIMITMNDDLMQYDTKQCENTRKKLSKYLGIGKYRMLKKIINKFK